MTDREKCFVLNGLRSYMVAMAEVNGDDVARIRDGCNELAWRLSLEQEMLEATRLEGQAFLTLITGFTQPFHSRGN